MIVDIANQSLSLCGVWKILLLLWSFVIDLKLDHIIYPNIHIMKWTHSLNFPLSNREQDMCLWNTDAPGGNKVKYGKNF